MSNEIKIGGSFNIPIQDVGDGATVNVIQILGKSIQYNDLLHQLETQQKLFNLTSESETEERLQISGEINRLKDFIEQFKKDVLQLAQAFQNIEINTDRLKRAKEFFDKGEFGEARAVFEMEIEQMNDNHSRLMNEKERFETEIIPKLKHNSEEFYILALTMSFDYKNPNRYIDTCKYFELSIESDFTKDNLYQYAHFLYVHNQFSKAINYYNQYLSKFANDITLQEKANTFNNLAILHQYQNEYEEALKKYEEALYIYRNLSSNNSISFGAEIASLLNNIGVLHLDQNKYEKALAEQEEALEIRMTLAKDNPNTFLPLLALTFNNLANIHQYQNEFNKALKEYEEALNIYQNLEKNNPNTFLSEIALTLNNLGGLYWRQKQYEKTLENIEKALKLRRKLAKDNPNAFLPHVATTLNNLAVLHSDNREYEKASKEFIEVLEIYKDLAKENPDAFLFQIADCFNNLGVVYLRQNEYKRALKELEYSLKIMEDLNEKSPDVYTPDLAMTLINIATIYQKSLIERKKSIEYLIKSIVLLIPIIEMVPKTAVYYIDALKVLGNWNLSDEEIESLIAEKMEGAKENKA